MILEGKHDKNKFKAVFLSGTPASGKTEFYDFALKHKDMKHLDADKVMMFLIKKYGGDAKDTDNYTKFKKDVRNKLEMMNKMYTKGGLGLVIDGTGRDVNLIKKLKDQLEKYGYETAMIFIKTPLIKAIEKSKKRERAVDIDYIKDTYKQLGKNIPQYKNMFSPFIEVNDTKEFREAEKKIDKWLKK